MGNGIMDKTLLYTASSIEVLEPLISNVMKGCTKQTALKLKEVIPEIDVQTLQKLHTFILVPILGELANCKLSNEVKKLLLDCTYEVLDRVQLRDVVVVKNILTMLMMEIFDKDSPTMIKSVPEEMKLSTMNCALAALKNMPYDIQDKFYVKDNVPNICQTAYTCLQLAESEKLRDLRIRAMEVVCALQQVPLVGSDRRSPSERKEIGDIFQFILPGASSKLISIISGDITQGSKVLSTAIFTLSSMIALVMEDYENDASADAFQIITNFKQLSKNSSPHEQSDCVQDCLPRNAEGMKKLIESSKGRTPEYRKKIAVNLIPYLSKIGAQCEHSDVKVCKAVARSCCAILMRCPISLKEGLSPLLDALIALTVHEDDNVRRESIAAVAQLTNFFSERNGYDFTQLAEENFYMLLTRLPRIVQEGGGARGASSVALLSGYVQLLGSSMRNVLSSSVHLQKLTLSLLHIVTLECSHINVSSEHSVRQLEPERCDNINVPWVRLRFSSDRAVLSNIEQLCDIMTEKSMGVFEFLSSQLVDTLYSVPRFRRESVLLLNFLLMSGCKVGNEDVKKLALSLLEAYLSPDLCPFNEKLGSVTVIARLQEDIATVCLLTEGIGCCVNALGKELAQSHLLQILYPLLERAGSPNNSISLAGRRALTRVALSCGFNNDVIALISSNMDYISHCMSIRLRHYNQQLSVFDALSLILRHCSPKIALGLYNIVLNVLQQSSDKNQSKNNEAHLRVFLTFAYGVRIWLNSNGEGYDGEQVETCALKPNLLDVYPIECVDVTFPDCSVFGTKWNVYQKLKEYQQNMRYASINENEEETLCNQRDPTEDLPAALQPHRIAEGMSKDISFMEGSSEKKEEIPELAKLLVLVLQRCLHFLPCQNTDYQFLAIRTLEVGLQALGPFTDTVLPLVHQIWKPLVGRLKSTQPPLILRTAFGLLKTMAEIGKDFLMSRTIKEVVPELSKFLINTATDSHLKDSGSAYRFSQKYKTQLALLSGLGGLACHLQFRGQDCYSLLTSSLPYLSSFQPHPLQVSSVSLIRSLSTLDADAVWWALITWWTPPHLASCLQLAPISSHLDCEENVKRLLGLSLQQSDMSLSKDSSKS